MKNGWPAANPWAVERFWKNVNPSPLLEEVPVSVKRIVSTAATVAAIGALSMPATGLAHKGGVPASKKPCPTHRHTGKHKGATHGKKKGSTRGKKCGRS